MRNHVGTEQLIVTDFNSGCQTIANSPNLDYDLFVEKCTLLKNCKEEEEEEKEQNGGGGGGRGTKTAKGPQNLKYAPSDPLQKKLINSWPIVLLCVPFCQAEYQPTIS